MNPTYGERAKKRFGQHFLHDRAIIGKIVAAIAPQKGDLMVEIGPGPGALTQPLLAQLDHLHVIEIDRDVIAHLAATLDPERLTIHPIDVLAADLATLGAPLRIVGNLPYNISTPILFKVFEIAERVQDATFMLQKEVVDRMAATPDTPDYGRLSVMLQYRFTITRLFRVPPGAFSPPPKVDSAMVRLVPLPADRQRAHDEGQFAAIVAAGFNQRRKTLTNALRGRLTAAQIDSVGVDPGRRAETLSVSEFVALANLSLGAK